MDILSNKKITFGKYKDETFNYVLSNDYKYCQWILGLNSNNNDMNIFKQYILNNIKIEKPPNGPINVTDLSKYYYNNKIFNNLVIEKIDIPKIKNNNNLPVNVYASFIDYLIRYKICLINNLEFKDSRAENMIYIENQYVSIDSSNKNIIQKFNNYLIDIPESFDILNDDWNILYNFDIYGEISDKLLKLDYLFNDSYKNMKEKKANYNDILNISLLHHLWFGRTEVLEYYDTSIDYNYNEFENYLSKRFFRKNILLNPSLENDILEISGDADIIIDNELIDIKCSIHIGLNINDFIQLLIYAIIYNYKIINKIIILNPILGYEYSINLAKWDNYDKFIELLKLRNK